MATAYPGDGLTRCAWGFSEPLLLAYHDEEWGVPLHDDRALYELLVLEGMQAGLSWMTVLRKRANFRRAMDSFELARVADYNEEDMDRLLADAGIIRNRSS
jgi:DNA-3-methyladenine glycosylase I